MLAVAALRNHRSNLRLSPEAAAAMMLYRWPGNVRELRNAMEAAAVLCEGETVTLAVLPEPISTNAPAVIAPPLSKASLEQIERQRLVRVLTEKRNAGAVHAGGRNYCTLGKVDCPEDSTAGA
jgi:DNA-binding NtrC family response regulator